MSPDKPAISLVGPVDQALPVVDPTRLVARSGCSQRCSHIFERCSHIGRDHLLSPWRSPALQ